MTYSTEKQLQNGILVHININNEEPNSSELLEELSLLCLTCGIKTVGVLTQNLNEPNPPTLIGTGKLEELKIMCSEHDAEVVVFDNELSGMKKKNIENVLGVNVLTRSMVILDIFAHNSKTAEGKLQTEIAQLKYFLPRLIGLNNTSNGRFGAGGVGMRGPGETKLELDKRKIRDRIATLEKDIEKLSLIKNISTKRRNAYSVPSVALVGYTNSGKSTLFNTITKAGVLSENKLFATLETVARYVYISDKTQIILSDTVGFINKLPHEFISAFRTTLQEAVQADILVVVIDATNKNAITEYQVVNKVLAEINAKGKKIFALNKTDQQFNLEAMQQIESENEFCVRMSALNNVGVDLLKKQIESLID